MKLTLLLSAILLGVAGCAQGVVTTTQQQDLVDRSTLALQEMLGSSQSKDLVGTLRSARAVIICPQVFKAGVVIGGSGGSCVLMGRAAAGSWSDPAFYSLGSGSFGPQIGVQDAELHVIAQIAVIDVRWIVRIIDAGGALGVSHGRRESQRGLPRPIRRPPGSRHAIARRIGPDRVALSNGPRNPLATTLPCLRGKDFCSSPHDRERAPHPGVFLERARAEQSTSHRSCSLMSRARVAVFRKD